MDYCDILMEEMYDARGIQLATEQTWRDLNIPINLGRRLKEALHPFQKKTRQVGGAGGAGGAGSFGGFETEAFSSLEELEELQVLEAMRSGC